MSDKYIIEKNVLVPETRGKKISELRKVLQTLEVGDSVVEPEKNRKAIGFVARKVLGKGNYATRPIDGGTRIWRLK